MEPRKPEFDFFSTYWRIHQGPYRRHRYHWFIRPCRSDLFSFLLQRPPGICVEIGPGRGSVELEESNPTDASIDLFPWLFSTETGVVGDAHHLPFRSGSLAAIWGQTVCMHLSWNHVIAECFRCVKKGGIIAFLEPMRDNPLIRVFRRFDPSRRSHPRYLSSSDISDLADKFGPPSVSTYFLLSPITILLFRERRNIVSLLQSMDAYLLKRFPFLCRYAWYTAVYWKV